MRETEFRMAGNKADAGIQEIYLALANDKDRNKRILDDVVAALEERRSPILLTERKDHLEYFAERLRSIVRHLVVLQGGMTAKERRGSADQLASIPDTAERLVLATGRYIGEGFDDARLDTLFLAMPVSWKGTLIQYSGRLHRHHARKTEVRIYDYVDREVPMLLRMFEKRLPTYRAIGYARGEAPLGFAEPPEERTIEYDEEGATPLRGGYLTARKTPRKRWPPSKTELGALTEEAIVDAYGDSEQRTGFYTMLEERLAMPFDVDVLGVTATVERIDMIDDEQIVAICRRGRSRQSIPILDLPLPKPPPEGAEWIEAYRRWARGS